MKSHQTGELVPATILVMDPGRVPSVGQAWKDYLKSIGASTSPAPGSQHLHWDWAKKAAHYGPLLSYKFLAVECQGQVQGLMLALVDAFAQIPDQRGKPLVYVHYVAAAPWNQSSLTKNPQFGLVGSVLIATAIELSRQQGFAGRIGLHSLPQSEGFYQHACAMQDLGPDSNVQGLRYFEMTPEDADRFYPR